MVRNVSARGLMSLAEASLRPHPQPHRGTLTPFIPLSLRAIKGKGERKTEACTCAKAQVHASSFGTGGRGVRTTEEGGTTACSGFSSG